MIGSHVADALLARGDTVHAIDDLSRGDRAFVHPDAMFKKLDIRDAEGLARLADDAGGFDAIIHQAALINEGIGAENADLDIDVNQRGTLALLDFARTCGVTRFVYASSVAVYGRPAILPVEEDVTIPEPVASYGIGKLAAEHYVRYAAAAAPGLGFAILRYANIYGPRQQLLGEVGVIRYFVESLAGNSGLTVHGDGEQVRDFLYIDDCVAATLAALDASQDMILNIGSGRATSVNEIVDALRGVSEKSFEVKHMPPRHGEIGRFWCSIEHTSKALGWKPEIGLETGVARTLDWRLES